MRNHDIRAHQKMKKNVVISQSFIADLDMLSSSGNRYQTNVPSARQNVSQERSVQTVAPNMDGTAMLERCRNTWKIGAIESCARQAEARHVRARSNDDRLFS